MPSSLSLIIYTFCFKVKDMQVILSLEILETMLELLSDLVIILLCLGELDARGEEERWEIAGQWSSQNTHNINSVLCVMLAHFIAPQNNDNSNIKDH